LYLVPLNYSSSWHTWTHIDTPRHTEAQKGQLSTTIKIKRICEHCGGEFKAYTTKTRYCSHKCNQLTYKAQKRTEKIENSNKKTREIISRPWEEIKAKPFLNIMEASRLFGISRRTIYRMIDRNEISLAKAGTRTILMRSDFDKLFDLPKPVKEKKEPKAITEFYTVKDIEKLFFIKYGRLNTIIKENNIPKTVHSGKLHVSKPHIDRYFKKTKGNTGNITEWYSVKELQEKYNLTRDQVYSRVHDNNIPKQRVGKYVKISKQHFDELFEIGV